MPDRLSLLRVVRLGRLQTQVVGFYRLPIFATQQRKLEEQSSKILGLACKIIFPSLQFIILVYIYDYGHISNFLEHAKFDSFFCLGKTFANRQLYSAIKRQVGDSEAVVVERVARQHHIVVHDIMLQLRK